MNKRGELFLSIIRSTVTMFDEECILEPMDGDEVDYVFERLKIELNLSQGNITQDEYENKLIIKLWNRYYAEK